MLSFTASGIPEKDIVSVDTSLVNGFSLSKSLLLSDGWQMNWGIPHEPISSSVALVNSVAEISLENKEIVQVFNGFMIKSH